MMIKEVAEEIGVHPSTVSRAVANKYAHTPQGVFELRYFFSESVNGPEGEWNVAADPQAPGQEADRRRRSGASADRRADHPHPAIPGNPGDSPHGCQVPRGHEDSEHPPKTGQKLIGLATPPARCPKNGKNDPKGRPNAALDRR
jgi:hypothetical protein